MLVRLIAKLAECVNDVDLSPYSEGDVIDLPERDARMLLAERWAEQVEHSGETRYVSGIPERAIAADRGPGQNVEPCDRDASVHASSSRGCDVNERDGV
jgi:hypothetical protein